MKAILFVMLAGLTASYLAVWVRSVWRAGGRGPAGEGARPGPASLLIGFVTNFFDTLGIGSFATTTSLFRVLGAVPDELIPGTLNVGHTVPSVTQAFIYIAIVAVAMPTLGAMIAAAGAGACLCAGVVSRCSGAPVQLAAYGVWALPLGAVRWLVIVVVVYTAVALLRAAQRERGGAGQSAAPAPGP